jgi:hypothetical protein
MTNPVKDTADAGMGCGCLLMIFGIIAWILEIIAL